ncbi:MAG: glycosyltransferase family 4 protein, partial [Waddliaceae bacterium]
VIFFATRPIAPPWDEGSKNMVYEIAKRTENFRVIVPTYKNQPDIPIHKNATFKHIYTQTHSNKMSLNKKLAFLSAFIRTQAAIFHFYFSTEILTSAIIRLVKKFKKGIFLQTIPTPLKDAKTQSKYIFGDFIVTQSLHTLNHLKNEGFDNVFHIYPGVDTCKFKPTTPSQELQRDFKIDVGQRVILYPGGYYLEGDKEMTETVLMLSKEYKNLKFIFACRIGFPSDLKVKKEMQVAFARANLLERVIFLDSFDNMLGLLSLSDIVVFPVRKMFYKSEIPMVLLEALAMEKPIIVSDIPPLNEIMKDDVGELIPPGEAEYLTKALRRLLDDPQSREAKGKNGRNMILKEFDIRHSAEKYQNLYHMLFEKHKLKQ